MLPLSFSLLDLLAYENRPEGGDGGHEECDAGFEGLPENLPDQIQAVGGGDSRHADDGDDDHGDGEAEEEAQAEFLALFDFGAAEDDEGDADDFFGLVNVFWYGVYNDSLAPKLDERGKRGEDSLMISVIRSRPLTTHGNTF